ncbi:MAG: aminodeoxychorismate synthase component I [Deltaproteobacteria bacterium]|nr:aminodeoxychorismate synthase component I [Deltaproteobacteria bacterium]
MTTRSKPIELRCEPVEFAATVVGRRLAFLESSQRGSALGRYSIIGWDPVATFVAHPDSATLRRSDAEEHFEGNPVDALDAVLARYRLPDSAQGDHFSGGAIGYLSYDLNRCVERLGPAPGGGPGLPLIDLAFYDRVLVYDHYQSKWSLSVCAWDAGADLDAKWTAEEIITTDLAGRAATHASGVPDAAPNAVEADLTAEEYQDRVTRALRHIVDGDIYQVNLAVRFQSPWRGEPFDLYRRLRHFTPSRYGAYLESESAHIISASPELFLRVAGSKIQTRPIKGTRRRTGDAELDADRLADLLASPKERAELSMIVDLERNDLGRVCEYGSVVVTDHAYVDELPTVFHTVSCVEGKLREGTRTAEVIRATFPGGSITGAPKIRAMTIIDDLEPVSRGPYTGAIGAFGFDGGLSLSIAIRTIVFAGGTASFHAGAGIVADSDPAAEYEEVLDKARAMAKALGAEL